MDRNENLDTSVTSHMNACIITNEVVSKNEHERHRHVCFVICLTYNNVSVDLVLCVLNMLEHYLLNVVVNIIASTTLFVSNVFFLCTLPKRICAQVKVKG